MTVLLDIPEQKIRQAEAVARAGGKTLQQILEEYVDELAQQKPVSIWQDLSEKLPDIGFLMTLQSVFLPIHYC